MSLLLSLTEDNLTALIPFIDKYEALLNEIDPFFDTRGKKLETMCLEQPQYLSRADQAYHELKSLEDWLGSKRDKVTAKLWKKYTEGYNRVLTTKDITMYIGGEAEYISITEFILEIASLKGKFQAVVEALKSMQWQHSNVVKLRVAELHDIIL